MWGFKRAPAVLAAMSVLAAGSAWAAPDEGVTIGASVNPIGHSQNGSICQVGFALRRSDPAATGGPAVILSGSVGVARTNKGQWVATVKLGVSPDTPDGVFAPAALAGFAGRAGDAPLGQLRADFAAEDPHYHIFSYTYDDALGSVAEGWVNSGRVRLVYAMAPDGPRATATLDITAVLTDDGASPARHDPQALKAFSDCVGSLSAG